MSSMSYMWEDPKDEVTAIVRTLTIYGTGIWLADESERVCGKRLKEIGLKNTPENRYKYRHLLFTCGTPVSDYLFGALLPPEAVNQKTRKGISFNVTMEEKGIICGVTFYPKFIELPGTDEEYTTKGLESICDKCSEFKLKDCHFARWRCVYSITNHTPSLQAIQENANNLAIFAASCQENRMLPILTPEVLRDGDHDMERCQKVTETVLSFLFKALADHNVYLEGILLFLNMIVPGKNYINEYSRKEIAQRTVDTLYRCVPCAVRGIFFLSGGQTEDEATYNLNNIIRNIEERCPTPDQKPWHVSFAFRSAIHGEAIKIWGGKDQNIAKAQDYIIYRNKVNGKIVEGIEPYEVPNINDVVVSKRKIKKYVPDPDNRVINIGIS